jgi:hypothetical protein
MTPPTPQVHEIVLREYDKYEDKPRLLHLIPLGELLGVCVTKHGESVTDDTTVFVAMKDLEIALPALGFTGAITTLGVMVIAPRNAS